MNPYDELPYCAYPIAMTAPEHLAAVSLLHGGPVIDAAHCRVLELGCANGANLLPMAWYRPGARFIGVDASEVQIRDAEAARQRLDLDNLAFLHGDFRAARDRLEGSFDVVIAHGVLSWIEDDVRDELLQLVAERLDPGGVFYANYNALPGWRVRGMVRDFLLQHTAAVEGLGAQAQHCRELAAALVQPLGEGEHPYTELMAREFRLVAEQDPAYIAHEYLSPANQPYWRSEFESLVRRFGFEPLASADFNSVAPRIIAQLANALDQYLPRLGQGDDAADLLCYSQMHSPVLVASSWQPRPCNDEDFSRLWLASELEPLGADRFAHPDGREIQVPDAQVASALTAARPRWPCGEVLDRCFDAPASVREDLEFLAAEGLVTLRMAEPGLGAPDPGPLHAMEIERCSLVTSPWHTLSPAGAE